jgi:photosystem II stability/assembly factor-like uncharacterized protein
LLDADQGKPTNWVPRAEGLEETAVLDLVSPPVGAHVISALGDIAGFAHFDLDKSPKTGMWTNPLWNTTNDVDFAGLKPLTVIRVGREQGAISHDGGITWKPFAAKPDGLRRTGSAAISADGKTIVQQPNGATTSWSDDEGTTWHQSAGDKTSGRIVADRVNPNLFWVHDGKSGDIFESRDGAKSFKRESSKVDSVKGVICPVFGHEGEYWIPLNGGVIHVKKDGTSSTLLARDYVEQIAFGKAAPGESYPAAFIIGKINGVEGIFRSIDEGKTWVRINDAKTGFGTAEHIEGDPKVFGRVYLGTNGRGVIVGDPKAR